MRKAAVLVGAGLIALGGIGAVEAQQPNPIQGTPGSLFPDAAPNEVQIINGVPCRTIYDYGTKERVPVQCVGPRGMVGMNPAVTGSIRGGVTTGVPASGTPASPFPYATPDEIRIINGVPCRTVLVEGTNQRVPVECAR
jgi:hypothetical protein